MHVLIYLAQFQAHSSRTAGAHKLDQRMQGALFAEDGEVRGVLCGSGEHNRFSHKLSVIGTQLLFPGGNFVRCGLFGFLLHFVLGCLGLLRRLGRVRTSHNGTFLGRGRLAHNYLRRRFNLFARAGGFS